METRESKERLVSVIIPSFNRWPHICDAIDSVIDQTHKNLECIIVDDASTDSTPERLLEKYRTNPKIRVEKLSQNIGQSAARNHGARSAKGELICFLDSDDILLKDSVKDRVSVYDEPHDFNGISFGINQINNKKSDRLSKKERLENLTLDEYLEDRGWLHTNAVMMPTVEFINLEGFNEKLRQREDIEFFIRSLCHIPAKFGGTTVSSMRAVDENRARHDYDKIISQGYGFFHALSSNTSLHEKASPAILNLTLRRSLDSYLSALYKKGEYSKYRKEILKLMRNNAISPNKKQFKRFLISFFRY
ncbi:glycosyltransferase family 2 protein [Chromohalobacter sp. 48-RD10]|uniref:glycosyltransferase family 2 protein n=1 Tax=Chromohalobacter sp. 48-RD10 TaxID=2994063 RepID=UPI0024691333|nr:glycosyltransferase family 2 protein [Chromohalobacter sp. 48-RD10]